MQTALFRTFCAVFFFCNMDLQAKSILQNLIFKPHYVNKKIQSVFVHSNTKDG